MKTVSLLTWLCVVFSGICVNTGASKDLVSALPSERPDSADLAVDAFIQQAKLTSSDGAANDWYASSVAMSGDGSTAIVGAYGVDVDGKVNQGAVYVYTRSGTAWTQQARLIAADGAADDNFGVSVALSSDGNAAIAGAFGVDVGGNEKQGAAYVFTRSGTSWSQQAKLIAADGSADNYFGASVGTSGDGSTAIVGAYYADVGGNEKQGAAYVFTRSGATWGQQAKLTALDGAANDYFGYTAAVSGDGNAAIAGAYYADVGGNANQGAAYVFTRSGADWSQQAKLTAPDGTSGDGFGVSAALSIDGTTAISGAYCADAGGHASQGAAYVFTRSGTSWNHQAKLTSSDGVASDSVGVFVGLSSDGNTAIAGAYQADVNGNNNQGAAYMFTRSGASWSQQTKLSAADGAANDYFGVSVAASGDGNTVIAGAYYADVGGNSGQGAAYVFAVSTLQFVSSVYNVLADAGSVTVTVTRANGSTGAASVNYATANGTAIAGTDYTETSGTLSWADGNADSKNIVIPIVNRSGAPGSRSFSVNLSDASGASLGLPALTTVTINDPPVDPVGPAIKANGAEGNVAVNYPEPVSISVAMNADIYAGVNVDWWVVAWAHSGAWYYLNSAMAWTYFNGDLATCRPVYQGALFNLPSTPVLNGYVLPRGTYNFWFAVDYPMDGILNPGGPILCDMVTVTVL